MSNFSNLFATSFPTEADYISARDAYVENTENPNLKNGDPDAGAYDYNDQPYTIGYGYDISQHSGQEIINDFTNAGIFSLDGSGNITGTYANLNSLLHNFNGSGTDATSLADLDATFSSDFGGSSGLSQTEALNLLDTVALRVEASISGIGSDLPYAVGNNSLHEFLFSEDYNGGNVFGANQASDISDDDVTDFLKDVLFFNNTEKKNGAHVYNQGIENRRVKDLAASTGTQAIEENIDGHAVVTGINFEQKLYPSLDVAQALIKNNPAITAHIDSLTGGDSDLPANNLTTLATNLLTSSESTLMSLGYYVPQPDTSNPSVVESWDNIASRLGFSIPGSGLSDDAGTTLQDINAVFSDTNYAIGGLVRVPVAAPISVGSGAHLPLIPASETYVFDPATDSVYTVGAGLNSSGGYVNGGALVIDTSIPSRSGFATFDSGSYSGISYNSSTNTISVVLRDLNGNPTGTFNINTSTGVAGFIGVDGDPTTITPGTSIHITAPTPGMSAIQSLVSELTTVDPIITVSSYQTADYTFLHPTGSSYAVSGSVSGPYEIFTLNTGAAPGAQMTGTDTYNYLALNGTDASFDITQDTLNNVQYLDTEGNNVTLTHSQFTGFSLIYGSGTITAADSGTFSLAASNIYLGYGAYTALTAEGWGGTTLIGNGTADQTLTASLYGNDTLTAGNGAGDTLVAGAGVDTLTGGTGGDSFLAEGTTGEDTINSLAAGSSVTGEGTGNSLTVNGDITGVSITGIQTLITGATYVLEGGSYVATNTSLTLTHDQWNGFTDIGSATGDITGFTINAGNGGTYDLSTKDPYSADSTESISLTALSNDGTTLIGSDGWDEVLTASATGTDTLEAGDGYSDKLIAGAGDDTLTAGDGYGDTLTAGAGTDTLTAGNGGSDTLIAGTGVVTMSAGTGDGDTFVAADGFASGSSVTAAGSDAVLQATGDITGATISGVATLETNDITLTNAQFNGFSSISGNGFGGEIFAADAGTYDLATLAYAPGESFSLTALSNGGTTLISNNGENEVLTASATGNDTLESGTGYYDTLTAGGGNDTLNAGGDHATLIGGGGTDAFILHDALHADDTVIGFTGSDTIDLIGATYGVGATASIVSGDVLQVTEGSSTYDTTLSSGLRYVDADFALANDSSGNTEVSLVNPASATLTVSAATASANIDTYETEALASTLGTVALSDPGIPTLTITATQLADDTDALNSIITPYTLAVTDVTAANAATVAAMPGVASVAVTDSAANVASNFDALGTLADEGVLASVALTDSGTPTLGVTTTQAQTDAAVFSLITTPFDVTFGSDTTAAFVSDGDYVLLEGSGNDVTLLGDSDSAGEWTGGNNYTLAGDNDTVSAFGTGDSFDVIGDNGQLEIGSGDTVAMEGTNGGAQIYGSGNTVTVDGSGNSVYDASSGGNDFTLAGSDNSITIHTTGSGDFVNVTGTGDSVLDYYLGGNTITITLGDSDSAALWGPDTAIASGDNASIYTFGTGTTVALSGNTDLAYVSGADTSTDVTGDNGHVELVSSGSDTVTMEGSDGYTEIYTSGNTVTTSGTGTGNSIADVEGGNTFTLGGSGNGITIHQATGLSGDTVNVTGTSDSVMDYDTGGNTITLGSSDSAVLYGASDTATISGASDSITAFNNDVTVTDNGTGGNSITLAGDSDAATVNNTGTDTLTVTGTNALMELLGSSTDQIIFNGSATGTILLDSAASFAGTVAGMDSDDAIDLSDFAFSGSPTVSGVSGTGATGTATDVTVTDGSASVTLALMNQYANQFAVSTSAYQLSSDGASTPGTLFEIAPGH